MERTAGFVYRYLFGVNAQAVTLCIPIGEQATLKHFIRREADTFYRIDRVEGCLLYICEIVFRVTVQFEDTHVVKREVAVRPYFGQVERIDTVVLRLFFRHQLDLEFPFREITFFDAFKQVALMRFTVFCYDRFRFLVCQVLDSLQGTQMEFHPDTFVVGIDKAVGMTTEAVHVTIRSRDTTGTHCNSYLMQCFRQ